MEPTLIAAVVAVAMVLLAVGGWVVQRRTRQRRLEGETPIEAPSTAHPPAPEGPSIAARFFAGLARSREALSRGLAAAIGGAGGSDEALQDIEDALVASDIGVRTAGEVAQVVGRVVASGGDEAAVRAAMRSELLRRMGPAVPLARQPDSGPLAILVVGVNGSGKTTTIGKLAARYRTQGKKVLLAAGDTFRAGAIEQLKVWGERAEVPVVAHQAGADPAAVVFDALEAAKARGMDVVICDTAGRLQAQKALMDELSKVVRVMAKALPGAPHEVLLVLDATIGQNALSQARVFKEVVGVTGVALTKLDGTAKGGVVVAVRDQMGIPVKLVGLGEKVEDLRDFEPQPFVDALVGVSPDAAATASD